jgi:hypothetical protein
MRAHRRTLDAATCQVSLFKCARCFEGLLQRRPTGGAPISDLPFSAGAGCHAGRKAFDAKWMELLLFLAHGIQEVIGSIPISSTPKD